MKRFAVLLLVIPLAGEAKLIREPNCPPPLEPFNQAACLACNETPWKESTPILFGELRGKKTLLWSSEVKFNYGLGGRDPDNRPVQEDFPLTLPVSLYEIGGGHYGCFRLPRSEKIYEEKTYCIPLAFESKESLNEYVRNSPNVLPFDGDNTYWSDNRVCLRKDRYEVTSPEIPEVVRFRVGTSIGVTTLKNTDMFPLNLKMSRQRIADPQSIVDKQRKYNDYQCLMLTPDYSVVEKKDSISGDLHACFKVSGPKPY